MKKLVVAGALLFGLSLSAPMWADAQTPGSGPHRHVPAVPAEHVAQHATMTEQMRSMDHSSHMAGDMWTRMRDPGHIAAEEHMQSQLDQMLARRGR